MPALGPASVRAACSSRSSGRGAFSHVLSPFFNLFSPDNLTFRAPVGEITGHVLVQCWDRNASVPGHRVLDLTCGAAEVGPGSPEPARVKGRQWRPFRPPCRGLRHEQRCPGEGGRIRGCDQRRESGGVAAGRGGAVGGHRLPVSRPWGGEWAGCSPLGSWSSGLQEAAQPGCGSSLPSCPCSSPPSRGPFFSSGIASASVNTERESEFHPS